MRVGGAALPRDAVLTRRLEAQEGARALSSRGTTPSYGGAHPHTKAHPLPREGDVDLPLSRRPSDSDSPADSPAAEPTVPRAAELRPTLAPSA